MKSSQRPETFLLGLLFAIFFFIIAPAGGRAQEAQQPLPRVPLKPVQPVIKPAPVRVPPQVRTQAGPQVQRPTPQQQQQQRKVQQAGGQGGTGGQNQGQFSRIEGNNPQQRQQGGVHQPVTPGGTSAGLRLPPNARSMAMPNGGIGVVHPDGRKWLVDQNHHVRAFTRPGFEAKYNDHGGVSSIHVVRPGNNMILARSEGGRTTVGFRPGNVMVVTFGKDRGYVQHPIPGRPGFFARTSLVKGQPTARVYRIARYRGIVYFRYVPAYSYQPQFYQWASQPWSAPLAYNWSGAAPWMGSFGAYFTPAASYASPNAWLTDYVIAQNLKTASQDQQEYNQTGAQPAPVASSQTAPIAPETTTAISQEVQAQVTAEQDASNQGGGAPTPANGAAPPPVLQPNQRTLIVTSSLDVETAGQTCTLTAGDVIYRSGDNVLAGNKVAVNVVSSKPGDCSANTSAQIEVLTLQEMHNQFEEQVDAGLGTLASSGGQGGVPPAGAHADPEGTAQPDGDAAATLAQQQTEADGAEKTATDGASAVSLL